MPRPQLQCNPQLSVTLFTAYPIISWKLPVPDKPWSCPLKSLREIHRVLAMSVAAAVTMMFRWNWNSIRFVFLITWRLSKIPLKMQEKKKEMGSTESEALKNNLSQGWLDCTSHSEPGELMLLPREEQSAITDATKDLNSQELTLLPWVFSSRNGREVLIKERWCFNTLSLWLAVWHL